MLKASRSGAKSTAIHDWFERVRTIASVILSILLILSNFLSIETSPVTFAGFFVCIG